MGTVFFAWELGGGLGHLMRIAPIAKQLVLNDHRVYVASRDVPAAQSIFGVVGIRLLSAPYASAPCWPVIPKPTSFSQILHNIGFGSDSALMGLTDAWQNLFKLVKPDVIVFDHSPTALLASRGSPARTVVIGSGFCVPPDIHPLPSLSEPQYTTAEVAVHEDQIIGRMNRCLSARGQPLVSRIGQLFAQTNQQILTTFRELDHYPQRPNARYWGPIYESDGGRFAPTWPVDGVVKIFAYLKSFRNLPDLLKILNEIAIPTLIYSQDIPKQVQREFASRTLQFLQRRPDTRKTLTECSFLICHATLATTTLALMSAKPVLLLPLLLEQDILAHRIQSLGAGIRCLATNPDMMRKSILEIMDPENRIRERAEALAESFQPFDAVAQQRDIALRLEELISQRGRTTQKKT